ncbi:hypothetical protein AOLI_G00209610 [Acnodon oligacanthus]
MRFDTSLSPRLPGILEETKQSSFLQERRAGSPPCISAHGISRTEGQPSSVALHISGQLMTIKEHLMLQKD